MAQPEYMSLINPVESSCSVIPRTSKIQDAARLFPGKIIRRGRGVAIQSPHEEDYRGAVKEDCFFEERE
jgi:hypothetical protein